KAYAERGIEDARHAGYADAEVNFHYCRGSSQAALTTPRDALPDYNAGIAIARKEENERLVADGLTWRGGVQSLLGEHALALVDFLDAQKFYDGAGEAVESEQNLYNIATAYRRLGERPEARRYLDRLMQFGIQRHDLGQQLSAHMQLGFLDIEADDPKLADARKHFAEALSMSDSLDSAVSRASALLGLAQVDNMGGDYRDAQVNLARAEAQLKISGDQSNGDMIALQEGIAHAGLGEYAQAIGDFDRSEALLRKSGNLRYYADLLQQRSRSHEALGETAQALADLKALVRVNQTLERKARTFTTTLMSYQFDTAQREQENRQLAAERKLQAAQLASLERVRRWQWAAIVLGGLLIALLLWQARRQVRATRRLHRMAMTDPLTGIANRRRIESLGQPMLDQAVEHGESMSVVVLDVDHFKQINDACGHEAGDQVLTRIVGACRDALREDDRIGRIGGEEFVVLLPRADRAVAHDVAERLRSRVQALDLADILPGRQVAISLGVATRAPHEADLASLIRRADQALYRAKARGRNRVEEAPPAEAGDGILDGGHAGTGAADRSSAV
ncbi:MAG: GGDEF domain-containing protein, partial [Xanthomonadaceae bacterium]|nr:GGDEF domain-containing protein [Xanthomonadaceae bacterium]